MTFMMHSMVPKPLTAHYFLWFLQKYFLLEEKSLSILNPLDENEITYNITDFLNAPLEMVKLGSGSSFL